MPRESSARSERAERIERSEVVVSGTVCPSCSEIAGTSVMRIPDPKRMHKCQRCRSQMTDAYKAKLPGLKEEMKRAREMPR